MITTLVRIPKEEYLIYKEIARRKGWSLAEFFRISARKAINKPRSTNRDSIWNMGTKIVFEGGPKNGSTEHDKQMMEAK